MTNELPKTYDPSATEDKLYQTWEEKGYFNAEVDENKKPFTIMASGYSDAITEKGIELFT